MQRKRTRTHLTRILSACFRSMQILKGVKGIGKIEFNKGDIVRHKLVQRIVDAYDKYDDRRKQENNSIKKE